MASYEWTRFLVVLVGGVLGFGLASSGLYAAGYGSVPVANLFAITVTAGQLVWVLGYGVTAFVLWFVWLRDLELTGV
ncbi:hypothetical protein [Halocalculus aciditolerans]|nr:hypothetical protein [Halocalculus aciditolerans]